MEPHPVRGATVGVGCARSGTGADVEHGSERTWAFADGPTTSVRRVVPASPDEVWAHVSDIGFPIATSPELHHTEWLDGATGPAVGARFLGHNERGDLTWTTTSVVTEHDPPHAFAWTPLYRPDDPDDPEPLATWRYDLEPTDGGTLVTQTVTLGPGRSGLTWAIRQRPDDEARIISLRLAQFEESMAANLDRLADAVS